MVQFKLITTLLLSIFLSCAVRESVISHIERVENGLLTPVLIKGETPFTLSERMEHYKTPGVSIVVIKNFKIDWAKNYGVMDIDTKKPVSDTTLFAVGSLSKIVTTMAVLKNVEEGKLTLDGNVNDQLVSWKLPENEFTGRTEVTIKHLLNHSGGVMYSPSYGYTLEDTPTLLQILNGEKPTDSRPVVVDKEPGTGYQYSNAGYSILQQLLIDIEKQSFPKIMIETVFEPLGMLHSSFEQPLLPELLQFSASGHRLNGESVPGKRLIYPHTAAVGLWTTANDMAKFIIELQLSLKNKSNKVLSAEMVEQMLSPFAATQYGLGVFLSTSNGEKYFSHAGEVWGFNCAFIAHRTDGYGAVVLTNSANGRTLHSEIIRSIARVYEWKGFLPEEYETVRIDYLLLEQYSGRYLLASDKVLKIFKEDGRLFMKEGDSEKNELFPISINIFIIRERNEILTFVKDENGVVKEVIQQVAGEEYTSKKMSYNYKVPYELLMEGKIEDAVLGYHTIKKNNTYDFYVSEIRLNYLGYLLLSQKKYDEAIAIFKLNVELYPASFNVYDSLGEAYMFNGNTELAIKNYEKSLELNPDNTNAVEMLKNLHNN